MNLSVGFFEIPAMFEVGNFAYSPRNTIFLANLRQIMVAICSTSD